MKLHSQIRIQEIAERFEAEVLGDSEILITGINEIHKVETGDLTFVDHDKYVNRSLNSNASVILVHKIVEVPKGKCVLVVDNPFDVYNTLTKEYYPYSPSFVGLKNQGHISNSAVIHANVTIGDGVVIGDKSVLFPNVVIYDNVKIGNNVIIHSGSIIGGHAFYYAKKGKEFEKWFSCGSVIIEDNVEIGSTCTIDKGVSGATRIGNGTKLDNQIHVGHGAEIGANCLFAAQCAIGGKAIIEDDVICWGQVGISKDVRVGKGAVISAQSGVSKSLVGGKSYFGSPAREIRTVQKEMAALRKLPEILSSNEGE